MHKKSRVLGMNIGTASGRLTKQIIFHFIKQLNLDTCFRCQEKILTVSEMSIDHKDSWLNSDDPIKLFFDVESNIAFSHRKCNSMNGSLAKKVKENRFGYRGVVFDDRKNKYRAQVWYNGEYYRTDYCGTAVEAAIAHDRLAVRLHGKEAVTNKKLGYLQV